MNTTVLVLRDDEHKQKALKRIREAGHSVWGIVGYYEGQNLVCDATYKSKITTITTNGYSDNPRVHTIKAFLEAIK